MVIPTFRDAASMRAFSRKERSEGKSIALVPTMGFLHKGHLSLVEAAREHADIVVVSIYINPMQFSKNEDFGVYPKNLEEDHSKLAQLQVAAIFQPTSLYAAGSNLGRNDSSKVAGASELRPGDHETFIQTELLQRPLCGKSRPHFFKGVATVVAKLFNIVEPDIAIFGSKDYQQLQVIKRMVLDLNFDICVIGMPIIREPDGLAMSSRNALLTAEHRKQAPAVYSALLQARKAATEQRVTDAVQLEQIARQCILQTEGIVDYIEVVDAVSLESVSDISKQLAIIAAAVVFGSVRLIDNSPLYSEPT